MNKKILLVLAIVLMLSLTMGCCCCCGTPPIEPYGYDEWDDDYYYGAPDVTPEAVQEFISELLEGSE